MKAEEIAKLCAAAVYGEACEDIVPLSVLVGGVKCAHYALGRSVQTTDVPIKAYTPGLDLPDAPVIALGRCETCGRVYWHPMVCP